MNCKNCGAPLNEGAQFCKRCGTAVTPTDEPHAKRAFSALWEKCKNNRPVLYAIAGGLVLLVVALILVICVTSCGRSALKTPEDVADAVIAALEKGDGDALCALAKTAEPFLGRHTEQFGEGDTPADVMRGYYRTLADSLYQRLSDAYGKRFALNALLSTEIVSDSGVFEPNRALNIEAEQYAILTGPLTVEGSTVGTLRLVAALQDGAWKLLVVYVY